MDGNTRKYKILYIVVLLLGNLFQFSTTAFSAVIEVSGMMSYGRSRFADGYNSTQRRYTGSLEFKFTPVSSIQFEYTDSTTKVSYLTNVGTLLTYYTTEAITYDDKIYSANWVQNLVPSKWLVQPYFKIGGGKMTRKYSKEYPQFGLKESVTDNSVTGVAGLGLRIFITRSMALKGEFNTYVPNFHFKSWKENQLFSTGVSWVF